MLLRLGTLALALFAFSTVACAPPTLEGTGIDQSGDTDDSSTKKPSKKSTKKTPTTGDEDILDDSDATDPAPAKKPATKPATTTPAADGTATPAFAAVYSGLSNCSGCHLSGAGSAPIFFGADADATYGLFKVNSFQLADSALVTKGVHAGPALTDAQKTSVTAWITSEN